VCIHPNYRSRKIEKRSGRLLVREVYKLPSLCALCLSPLIRTDEFSILGAQPITIMFKVSLIRGRRYLSFFIKALSA
jgi:hypothetical protein